MCKQTYRNVRNFFDIEKADLGLNSSKKRRKFAGDSFGYRIPLLRLPPSCYILVHSPIPLTSKDRLSKRILRLALQLRVESVTVAPLTFSGCCAFAARDCCRFSGRWLKGWICIARRNAGWKLREAGRKGRRERELEHRRGASVYGRRDADDEQRGRS